MNIYRHGDILIKQIKKIPEGAKPTVTKKKYVLAEGEVTGHFHLLESKGDIVVCEAATKRFLSLDDECILTHQEHNTLQIDPGYYEIIEEREYDYIDEEMKRVID